MWGMLNFDRRIGVAGLVVALVGVAAPILWPGVTWIFWLCIAVGLLIVATWVNAELFRKIESPNGRVLVTAIVWLLVGAGFVFLLRRSIDSHSKDQAGSHPTHSPSSGSPVSPPSAGGSGSSTSASTYAAPRQTPATPKLSLPQNPQRPTRPSRPPATNLANGGNSAPTPSPAGGNQINGGIAQGPCGVVQMGGVGNTANTTCTPPERHLESAERDAIVQAGYWTLARRAQHENPRNRRC